MIKFLYSLFLGLFFFYSNAFATNIAVPGNEAHIWATQKGHELIQTLGMSNIIEKHSILDRMLLEDVNLDYVSKFVIGKYGKKMNKEQKRRYSILFRRYILSLYKRFNLKFNSSDIGFEISEIKENPKFTTVNCLIDASKLVNNIEVEKIPVEFKLIRGEKGKIQAVDIEISNISMVIEYRKKFYQMIMEEGEQIDWFLEKLEDKVVANEDALKMVKDLSDAKI
ncbi:MAG: ABC transporter substrate-binding protein [Alphaproteobacteria bacterium]|nr:ABC transporter substrate-binding protein [Alphaproteobacteria bacterium]